ncbi:MAG: hypothetical protein NT167_24050, partial [Verrucomicrobia bacterium]|nr:hypothetical protein [Verrucomicrobiota bacterium]
KAGAESRNPKPENRRKSEIREPKSESETSDVKGELGACPVIHLSFTFHVSRFTFNFCCVLLTPPTDSLGSGNRFKNMKLKEAFYLYEALKGREHATTKRRACL